MKVKFNKNLREMRRNLNNAKANYLKTGDESYFEQAAAYRDVLGKAWKGDDV